MLIGEFRSEVRIAAHGFLHSYIALKCLQRRSLRA